MVEGESQLPQVILLPPHIQCPHVQLYACTHTQIKSYLKKLMETDLVFCIIKQETQHSGLIVILDVMCT